MNLDEKLDRLNSVDSNFQFTLERESQGTIAFLDTEIVRKDKNVKFKVYRKPSNKESYVHFFSGHSERVKRGIVLGFSYEHTAFAVKSISTKRFSISFHHLQN